MLAPILFAASLLTDSTQVFDGRAHRTHVDVPRIDAVATIDGVLDEPVWKRAPADRRFFSTVTRLRSSLHGRP